MIAYVWILSGALAISFSKIHKKCIAIPNNIEKCAFLTQSYIIFVLNLTVAINHRVWAEFIGSVKYAKRRTLVIRHICTTSSFGHLNSKHLFKSIFLGRLSIILTWALTVRWKILRRRIIDRIIFYPLIKTDNHGGSGMTPKKHYVNKTMIIYSLKWLNHTLYT